MKDKMLRVRIEEDIFYKFKKICKNNNTDMSKLVYNYILTLIMNEED